MDAVYSVAQIPARMSAEDARFRIRGSPVGSVVPAESPYVSIESSAPLRSLGLPAYRDRRVDLLENLRELLVKIISDDDLRRYIL
jgi:hypothetical protein